MAVEDKRWIPSNLDPLAKLLPQDLQLTPIQLRLYDRAIYSISNSDVKAAMLVHGLTSTPTRIMQIRDRMLGVLESGIWLPVAPVMETYLESSLLLTGVVREVRKRSGVYYETSAGDGGIVRAIAATLLKYSTMSGIPYTKIYGDTNTDENTGVRSHINRTALLLFLDRQDSFEAQLSHQTGLDRGVIKDNLIALREIGLVNYDSVNTEDSGWVVYRKVGDESMVKHSSEGDRLRRNTLEFFRVNNEANVQAITQALGRTDEDDVVKIVSGFVDEGFLERPLWYGGVKQSDANIADLGRQFVGQVLRPVLRALMGDQIYVQQLAEVLREVESDPSIASQAIRIYREKNPRISADQTAEAILNHIRVTGPTRTNQFIGLLGGRVEPVLRRLRGNGEIVSHRIGKATFHMLPGMEASQFERKVTVSPYETPKPEKLIPPTGVPATTHKDKLELLDFWRQLNADLSQVPSGGMPEWVFFRFYPTTDIKSKGRGSYQSGVYASLVNGLRKLGIENPYDYMRSFTPQSDNSELLDQVVKAQKLLKERLTSSFSRA